MNNRKNIFAIVGSASKNSSNLHLVKTIKDLTTEYFEVEIFNSLEILPHFNTELSTANTPQVILDFRNSISKADGILICTPEYIFSIPSRLKNAIEWCVSTTVFSGKPIGIITASASGIKGHEELKLIMRTVDTVFTDETTLLIQGIKGRVDNDGNVIDVKTIKAIEHFIESFKILVNSH